MASSHWDSTFRALSKHERRRLLTNLLEHSPQRADVVDGVEGADADRRRAELVHVHLPLLERLGYVKWDRDAGEVVRGPAFDEVRPLLELIEDNREAVPVGWP